MKLLNKSVSFRLDDNKDNDDDELKWNLIFATKTAKIGGEK